MGRVATWDLIVVRGDAFFEDLAFVEEGGRTIDDLHLVDGSTTATSQTAQFTTGDTGKQLMTVAEGVPDGTTMTFVSATQVTLSQAATVSVDGCEAHVRALDCSTFTDHLAQLRPYVDGTPAVALTVDDARAAVGYFTIALAAELTAALKRGGVWDWQVTDSGNVWTWLGGDFELEKDVAHA